MKMQSDVSLASWCTLDVGGPARWFYQATDERGIQDALAWASDRKIAVHVLGGGSNVVIADEGFDGLVVHINVRGVRRSNKNGHVVFNVGAGEPWDPFVAATVAADCAGLECLSGIPGQVGGTPVQNVGAYGQDVSGTISRVHAIDRVKHNVVEFVTNECGFGYRTSRFKRHDRFIVSRVEYALTPHGVPTVAYADVIAFFDHAGQSAPTLREVRDAILRIRRSKGMVIESGQPANRSVGSFFVNPIVARDHFGRIAASTGRGVDNVPHYPVGGDMVKVPAAWLIEHAGFPKGVRRGAIGVSPFQAQAIVNHGGARASEVVALAADIKRAVWKAFEIPLVPEPVFVGFTPTPELQWLMGDQGGRVGLTGDSSLIS